ncbi:MAG: DNA internalization-related competence protein ComEC/Rec2 [Gammaproteobacteria bacterium]|nr:DNA internalization-related competence protein ComEC/Rec2 [Gammaproteobacteria bacterium]
MQLWIVAFFLGICFLQLLPAIPIFSITFCIIACPATACLSTFRNKYCLVIFGFAFGFFWALTHVCLVTSWSLPKDLEKKTLVISGDVASLPQTNDLYTSFIFATDTVGQEKVATKIKLSWSGTRPNIIVGDKWQLLVRLKRPHGLLNPGGFDLEKYLFAEHIRATGYVLPSTMNQLLAANWYSHPLDRLRQKLQQKIAQALFKEKSAGIISALLVGDENAISTSEWQLLRATGTSYLVAISGLHIGFVATIGFLLIQFFWRRVSKLTLWLPSQRIGAIAAFFAGLIYAAISGFSIPTQRSLLMLIVFLGAIFFKRHFTSWHTFSLALFCVLLVDPLALLTKGFWLSFIAVAAILYAVNYSKYVKLETSITQPALAWLYAKWIKYWQLQLTITIALMPLSLLLFQQLSFVAIIANIVALPGVCLIVVPLGLLASSFMFFPGYLGGWILTLAAKIMSMIYFWLACCSKLSFFCWQHAVVNYWVFTAAIIGMLCLLAPRNFPAKWLGIIWFLPLIFYLPKGPGPNEVWFTLLDVGQGLASVIRTQKHVLVYDTGIKQYKSDSGETVVLPFLASYGLKDIDMMVVSHGDNDHIGGANSILAADKVSKLITSVPERFAPGRAEHCYAGQTWQWDGVKFQILAPNANTTYDGNNSSCVLRITCGKNSLLLTGDIEREAEDFILSNTSLNLQSSILVAPHHGSRTSSSPEFVVAVKPSYVLFPTGYLNRFHFPVQSVIKRYLAIDSKMFNTEATGAITFKIKADSAILEPELYRNMYRHYWSDVCETKYISNN